MTNLTILDATVRANVAASTTQTGEIAAVVAPWSGTADVVLRYYTSADVLLDTVTHATWVLGTANPRTATPGAFAARSWSSEGTAAYCTASVGATPYLRSDVALADAVVERKRTNLGSGSNGAGFVVTARASLPAGDPYQIAPDGLWTWFTSPVAVFYNGSTYCGYVKKNGTQGITKYVHATSTASSFDLATNAEVDDHNNAAVLVRTDGKIATAFSIHTENGFRQRISTSAEDVSAFDAVVSDWPSNPNPNSYSNLLYLSTPGLYYNWYREGQSDRMGVSTSDWATWSAPAIWTESGAGGNLNCYTKTVTNGTNRVDFLFTDMAPNSDGTTSLNSSAFHGYMTVNAGGTQSFFDSAGNALGGGKLTNTTATKIIDYTDSRGNWWIWDITYGAGNEPQVLVVGFADHADHVYVHGRWNGSAWVCTTITTAGPGLYTGNDFYSGGMCFDAHDATKVYLSKKVGSSWELQEWRTTDNGATWAKYRDITSGSASGVKNCRPMSPRNHDGRACVVWWSGTYTDFYVWDTVVKAIASA